MVVVHNDLLLVIVSYATTKTTFDLLNSFAPTKAYDAGTWKRKAVVETRGLVLTDDSIRCEWYAYYLACNKTIYGNMMIAKLNRDGDLDRRNPHISRDAVLFYYEAFRDTMHPNSFNIAIEQRADYSIVVTKQASRSGRIVIPFDRRLRTASIDTDTDSRVDKYNRLVLVDEYGDVWCVKTKFVGDWSLTRCPLGNENYITACASYPPYFLTRDGHILFASDSDMPRIIPNIPKIAQLDKYYSSYNHAVQAVTHDNNVLQLSYREFHREPAAVYIDDRNFISLKPTSMIRYNPSLPYQWNARLIGGEPNTITTTSRTVLHTRRTRDNSHTPYTVIKETKNHTQCVLQVEFTIYVILDYR